VKIKIPAQGAPAEVVQDFQMPRPETGPFTLRVTDADGRPVAGAVMDGEYASAEARHYVPRDRTDDQGRFEFERSLDPLVLYARTADRKQAGVVRVAAEATESRLAVGPLASASGRLVDLAGKPVVGKTLSYGIHVYHGEKKPGTYRECFGGSAVTDDVGGFMLAGLVPGEAYQVSLRLDERSSRHVTTVRAKDTTPFELGEFRVDPSPPQPYVPPTPAQRTADAFAPGQKASPAQRKDRVRGEARRMYTRPLLLFGGPKDPACMELYRLFEEETTEANKGGPQDLRWAFELAALDTAQPDVPRLAAALGVKDAAPCLAVLDSDGSLAATYPLRLDARGKLDGKALATFLARHKLPQRDAEQMLADALRRAKADDKRVFLIASASWCGPCRRLARFLEAQHAELERHYVFVKLDVSRDAHGDAVRARYQGKQGGGVPWYVILDPDGKPLITSNAPPAEPDDDETNIGFPSSPPGIEHFLRMLRQTAPRLTDDRLAALRQALSGTR